MTKSRSDAIRVIFIDDELSVLDGINRIQRRSKPNWKAKYISSSTEALDILQRFSSEFDVVVTDINMPRLSGLKLLEVVFQNSPSVGRIALSGQLDTQSMMGIHKYADCQICKPVDLDVLFEKIQEIYLSRD